MLKAASIGTEISVVVTDPSEEDNPFIGCSRGFAALTGYQVRELLGRNCRLLREYVPSHLKNQGEQAQARKFWWLASEKATKVDNDSQPCPEDCCCSQINCKKDGSLFWNVFLLHCFFINGKAYVLGLQSKVDVDNVNEDLLSLQSPSSAELKKTSRRLQGLLKLALDRLCTGDVDEAFENNNNTGIKNHEKHENSFWGLSGSGLEVEIQQLERNQWAEEHFDLPAFD